MSTSSNPGPDDHDALSAWERRVLADIEEDLSATDPGLAHAMARRPRVPSRAEVRWWPMSLRSTLLLFVALALLIVAAALVPASWSALLGLITTVVIIPWLLLSAIERRRPD
jgi:hypothetical protein